MNLLDEESDARERNTLIYQFLIVGGAALVACGTILVAAGILVAWIFT